MASLTEGFGLPVLEALAFGCPVVASNAASLPEVCGDAPLYADPKSPRDWLDQIKRLRAEPNLSQILRAEGPRQAMRFSWAKNAQLYLDLIMLQAQPIETAAVQSALLASRRWYVRQIPSHRWSCWISQEPGDVQ